MADSTKTSFRKKITTLISKWWLQFFHLIAFVVVVFDLIPKKWKDDYGETGWLLVGFLGVSIFALIIINYVLNVEYANLLLTKENEFEAKVKILEKENQNLNKKAAYADIFQDINEAFWCLDNNLNPRNNKNPSVNDYKTHFKDFCVKISSAFSKVTGKQCHVCIKISVNSQGPVIIKKGGKKNDLRVGTLVRDGIQNMRHEIDSDKNIKHLYTLNSDYKHIYENVGSPDGKFFFCNSLIDDIEEYKNTSFIPQYATHAPFPKNTPKDVIRTSWKLKYKSTIVVPICPGIQDEKTKDKLIGFLTVDCPEEGLFLNDISPSVMVGCADGLYPYLLDYFALIKKPIVYN